MENEEKKAREKGVVEYALASGAMLSSEAVEMLTHRTDFKAVIDGLVKEGVFQINAENLDKRLVKRKTKLGLVEEVKKVKERKDSVCKAKFEPMLYVMEQYDVTGQSDSAGTVKDFLNYFRYKYEKLSEILSKHSALMPREISRLKAVNRNNEVDIIGMVRDKWVSKSGNLAFRLEDLNAECIAVVPKGEKALVQAAKRVMLDSVIGVKAVKGSGEMVIVKEFRLPDMPQREIKRASRDLNVAAISDLHVGSKLFMEREFNRFIAWIRGEVGNAAEREMVGKIRYLVLAGDCVDGIGVYPEQYDELLIKDIYKQYEEFSRLMEQIPECIEVVICPGQHDAVRRADPQPAIEKEFVPRLYEKKNVHFVGSPTWFKMENLNCLLYHGASFHDLYANLSYLNPTKPQEAVVELLKRRDLMPLYGLKQPYVPEKKDFMLVHNEPDIYFGGDMHHNGYGTYRGTIIINSGTWQKQTAFQISQGHVPTPGIVPVLNLNTGKVTERYFSGRGE